MDKYRKYQVSSILGEVVRRLKLNNIIKFSSKRGLGYSIAKTNFLI